MKICIVSSGAVSMGPRVQKEADTLAGVGHDVTVVACQVFRWLHQWDRDLAREKRWQLRSVRFDLGSARGILTRYLGKLRQVRARAEIERDGFSSPKAEKAFSRLYRVLLSTAERIDADLYIAHNLAALPIVTLLAERKGALAAFDSEDDHVGELIRGQEASFEARLTRFIEQTHLPKCAYLSAASEGISAAIAERYRLAKPTAVYNVFPWAHRARIDGKRKDRAGSGVSFFWYSQTLALSRGLGDVIRAAGTLHGNFEIHLRGVASRSIREEVLALAAKAGCEQRIHLHGVVSPDELLSRCAEHDVGLAIELTDSDNRDLTVTNKLFSYLLAGLAVIATDTKGQRSILETCPKAGALVPVRDVAGIAKEMQRFIDEPETLESARKAALLAAETRWNWERESGKLLGLVDGVTESRRHASA